ncbi:MAG TPA: hypothetical protein VFS48_04180 [Solirubrobacterales bacterium]|nr:hypothetical protein [Solirubrobacterales bacterium]
MKKQFGVVLFAVVAMLVGASPATAATEVGSDCQATNGVGGYTFVQLKRVSGGSLPIAAPSGGVVTKWKVNSGVSTAVGQKLQILRPTGAPNQFQTVAESTPATVSQGLNSFDTRIPIQAGDRPAVAGAPGGSVPAPLYCAGDPADEMGALTPESTLGSTNTYPPAPGLVAAVSAVIEPDADNDGFGDETQDKCPQSSALQAPCPTITLSASSIVKKSFARALITSNVQASVTVTGKVKLGKGKTAKLSGGVQVVTPGTIAKFTLIFPEALKAKLKELSRKQSLQLVLTATAPNIVGAPTVSTLKAKVKGQKKPVRKGKKGKGGKQG